MVFDPDFCRSLLFVPAGNDRFLKSALRGSADVIQVDLEDSIPPGQKESARGAARGAIEQIHGAGRIGIVRVNSPLRLLVRDLEAVMCPGLAALTIPKVSSGDVLKEIDATLDELEQEHGLPSRAIRLIALIESAEGILNVREIAASTPRLAAITAGSEDLAADLGSGVEPDALFLPNMQTLIAARAAGITPLGFIGSIAVYNEPETFRGWIRRARQLGFEGASCIHPRQVDILNEEFAPSTEDVDRAHALIDAFEAHSAEGTGAFSFEGRMVDAPVIGRARRVLKRHKSIAAASH